MAKKIVPTKRGVKVSEAFIQVLHRRTQLWGRSLGYGGKVKYSPKAKAIKGILETADFGCKAGPVTQIMSLLIQEPLLSVWAGYRGGTVIVLMEEHNSESYPVNFPILVPFNIDLTDAEGSIQIDGEEGNCLDNDGDYVRPATLEEIRFFFQIVENTGIVQRAIKSVQKQIL